jgi:hypothetical protein
MDRIQTSAPSFDPHLFLSIQRRDSNLQSVTPGLLKKAAGEANAGDVPSGVG